MSEIKQPASALSSPRFCNMGTFMRMQKVDSAEGLDFAIAGAPFDTASSFRSGSRFGPNAIRNISAMMKPNNVIMQVNIMDGLKGGDIGDFNVTPGYIHPTYQAIEEGVANILKENACPIVLGGDHSITLAELRAVAKSTVPLPWYILTPIPIYATRYLDRNITTAHRSAGLWKKISLMRPIPSRWECAAPCMTRMSIRWRRSLE